MSLTNFKKIYQKLMIYGGKIKLQKKKLKKRYENYPLNIKNSSFLYMNTCEIKESF